MIQRTLGDVRAAVSQVSGMTGMSLTDTRFVGRVNEAQEEMMNEQDWPGVVDRWHLLFDEISGELVLPYYLDRLMQVTVDRVPVQIMSPWAEFVQYGVGPRDDCLNNGNGNNCRQRCWISDCLDRGEVVSRFPIPVADGPWVLRVYATVEEEVDGADPVMNIQGYKDKKVIRTQYNGAWINGETLAIDFDVPYTQGTAQFDSLSAIIKPQTNGYVSLRAWNGLTEVTLSDYAPVETTPSYRNYFIERLWRRTQGVRSRVVLARARRRFVPVAKDNDPLIISNVNAVKCMVIAQWKRDAGDYEAYAFQKSQAVDIMNKEAMGYRGKARTPAISYQYGYPIGAMPSVR